MPRKKTSPADDIAKIREKLGHFTLEPTTDRWLDTGDPSLNAVLGSSSKGIPHGKILELYGPASHGKTMLALHLARKAQEAGTAVVWMDFENSWDDTWAQDNGLDPSEVYVLRPMVGRFGGKLKKLRLQTAEEVFTTAEELLVMLHNKRKRHCMVVVDSVAAILVSAEADAGVEEQSMRTRLSLAAFLGTLMRRWTAFVQNYGTLAVFINQLRDKPGAVFGSMERTPGGRALEFHAAIRARIRRVKGGRMMSLGKIVGLRGVIANKKNKAGGGSVEGIESGYVTRFRTGKWTFPGVKDVTGDDFKNWEPDEEGEADA